MFSEGMIMSLPSGSIHFWPMRNTFCVVRFAWISRRERREQGTQFFFVSVDLGVGMFEPLENPLATTHIALAARFEFPLRLRVVAGL